MPPPKVKPGDIYERLTVVQRVANRVYSSVQKACWLCKCDCGNATEVISYHLTSGNTKSCGCLQREWAEKLGQESVASGRIQELGRIQGKLNVESGHMKRIQSLPQTKKARQTVGKIWGPIRGRANVESGQMDRAREKFIERLKLWGPSEEKLKQLAKLRTREHQVMAGRLGGLSAVKSGQIFKIAVTDTKPELSVKALLDAQGIRYVHPFNLGNKFLCDFYLPTLNMVIEVDGCYWHGCGECGYLGRPERTRTDPGRNSYIKACGYDLLILREHEAPHFESLRRKLDGD